MRVRRASAARGLIIGLGGTALVSVVFFLADTGRVAVPALLLLIPIALASIVGGAWVGVVVAATAAIAYAIAFLPPVGEVHVGYTQDVFVLITFVGVAVAAVFVSRPPGTSNDTSNAALDAQRAMLLRSVSHDLRNPLNTIKMLSTDLRDRQRDIPGGDGDLLDLVVGETERLDRIVGNLLSYSRIQAGTFAPAFDLVAPRTVLAECAARQRRLTSHAVRWRVQPEVPDVWADPVQIDQVITNLVENSIRHSPEGSEVFLTARHVGHRVQFSVRDRGVGMPNDFLGTSWTCVVPGQASVGLGRSGLGLTICSAIVEAHHGSITADNRPSGGTEVTFELPIAMSVGPATPLPQTRRVP